MLSSGGPPEEAGHSCEGGHNPRPCPARPPDQAGASFLGGHCWTGVHRAVCGVSVVGWCCPRSALAGAGARAGAPGRTWTFQRPPETTPPCFLEAISLTSLRGCRSSLWPPGLRGQGMRSWSGKATPRGSGQALRASHHGEQAAPAPVPPKHSRLSVCRGDLRSKHTGLRGHWFCLSTH